MQVTYNGKTYKVRWQHTKHPYAAPVQATTDCLLINTETSNLGVSGQAHCSWGDAYDRQKGMKYAFARAVQILTPRWPRGDSRHDPAHVAARAAMWEQYRTMTKTPRW